MNESSDWQVVLTWPFLGGLVVFGYQIYEWLRFGDWTPITLAKTLAWAGLDTDRLFTGWVGLDQIMTWCLKTSIAWDLILVLTPTLCLTYFCFILAQKAVHRIVSK